jgi:hypothetical protein
MGDLRVGGERSPAGVQDTQNHAVSVLSAAPGGSSLTCGVEFYPQTQRLCWLSFKGGDRASTLGVLVKFNDQRKFAGCAVDIYGVARRAACPLRLVWMVTRGVLKARLGRIGGLGPRKRCLVGMSGA